MTTDMTATGERYHLNIHKEDGMLWAEVVELPGCFMSGKDYDELYEAAVEAIGLYLGAEPAPPEQDGSVVSFLGARLRRSQRGPSRAVVDKAEVVLEA